MLICNSLWNGSFLVITFSNDGDSDACSIDADMAGDTAGKRTVVDVSLGEGRLNELQPLRGIRFIFKGSGSSNP